MTDLKLGPDFKLQTGTKETLDAPKRPPISEFKSPFTEPELGFLLMGILLRSQMGRIQEVINTENLLNGCQFSHHQFHLVAKKVPSEHVVLGICRHCSGYLKFDEVMAYAKGFKAHGGRLEDVIPELAYEGNVIERMATNLLKALEKETSDV